MTLGIITIALLVLLIGVMMTEHVRFFKSLDATNAKLDRLLSEESELSDSCRQLYAMLEEYGLTQEQLKKFSQNLEVLFAVEKKRKG